MKKSPESSQDEIPIKIMILGNTSVGKTSFIIKYTENTFQEVYLSTIGIDYKIKKLTYNEQKYNLYIYDTTGEERFRSLSFNLIKFTEGVILMYDITNKSSFKSIPEWIESAREHKGENYPIIIIGNKIDLEEKRKITTEEGENLAKKYGLDFFEISNKEDINIKEAIFTLFKKVLIYIEQKDIKGNSSILSSDNSSSNKKSCC
jgi:small GTP-binding protein